MIFTKVMDFMLILLVAAIGFVAIASVVYFLARGFVPRKEKSGSDNLDTGIGRNRGTPRVSKKNPYSF